MVAFVTGAKSSWRTRLDLAFFVWLLWQNGETAHNAFFDRKFRVEDDR